ncbi:response regulator [Desulfogranum japonicum]|uniref:response regulator n=1 Tax=Desulfogranum japonicum TaxID=231447 RepID=UPI0004276757|nr:response regulator [Desulfogranum japonicum]
MFSKSLKYSLLFIVFAITLQLIMNLVDSYLQYKKQEMGAKNLACYQVEHTFMTTLVLEGDAELSPSVQNTVLERYRQTIRQNTDSQLGLEESLLHQRIRINSELSNLRQEQQSLYSRLNTILPELAGSVSYIHRHHIAYLKNLEERDSDIFRPDAQLPNKQDIDQPAVELNIISAAIDIQQSMLNIVEIFTRLQRGHSPRKIHNDFTHSIHQFYKATNTFEELSLDAQDGLLVEKLLLNGRTFEQSFKRFLDLEVFIQREMENLAWNRQELMNNLQAVKTDIKENTNRFSLLVRYIRIATLCINFLIVIILFTIARKIIRDLKRVVLETSKIEEDHSYRITPRKKEYAEFSHIFNSLNKMGCTIAGTIEELDESRNMLEEQVAARTADLHRANRKLTAEIEERVKNESERQELEERLSRAEKMEALGMLAGGVAHDLNNLLSGIVSYPELLLMNLPEDHSFRKPLQKIMTSGEQAAIIVEDLLTMARRGVAKQKIINIHNLIEEFQDSHEFSNIQTQHPQVAFEFHLQAAIPTMIGSKVHLTKALTNLVSNAAEAITKNGIVEICTSDEYIDTVFKSYDQVKEGEYIRLRVKDNGLGIPDENLEKIFEPFFTTKSMGRSGSGLGMAVVWGTVKDHNGYINVVSDTAAGTTFDLYFPLQRFSVEEKTTHVDLDLLKAKGEKVLVIDDVKEQRQIATLLLEELGYEAVAVESGEMAVAYLREHTVDILLLDMIMEPGMDGLATYREICRYNPRQKAIIVSGFSESAKVVEAQRLGAGAYIKKPYSIAAIAAALRQELDE